MLNRDLLDVEQLWLESPERECPIPKPLTPNQGVSKAATIAKEAVREQHELRSKYKVSPQCVRAGARVQCVCVCVRWCGYLSLSPFLSPPLPFLSLSLARSLSRALSLARSLSRSFALSRSLSLSLALSRSLSLSLAFSRSLALPVSSLSLSLSSLCVSVSLSLSLPLPLYVYIYIYISVSHSFSPSLWLSLSLSLRSCGHLSPMIQTTLMRKQSVKSEILNLEPEILDHDLYPAIFLRTRCIRKMKSESSALEHKSEPNTQTSKP